MKLFYENFITFIFIKDLMSYVFRTTLVAGKHKSTLNNTHILAHTINNSYLRALTTHASTFWSLHTRTRFKLVAVVSGASGSRTRDRDQSIIR